jgi:hypothetical protein
LIARRHRQQLAHRHGAIACIERVGRVDVGAHGGIDVGRLPFWIAMPVSMLTTLFVTERRSNTVALSRRRSSSPPRALP